MDAVVQASALVIFAADVVLYWSLQEHHLFLSQCSCDGGGGDLLAGVIVGGWDPKDGGQVYTVTLGGTMVRQKFSIGGEDEGQWLCRGGGTHEGSLHHHP